MNYLYSKTIENSFIVLTQNLSNNLTSENQRIAVIGALALACLAACYLIYHYACFRKTASVIDDSSNPDESKGAEKIEAELIEYKQETESSPALITADNEIEFTKRLETANLQLKKAEQEIQKLKIGKRKLRVEADKVKGLTQQIHTLESENRKLEAEFEDSETGVRKLRKELRSEKQLSFQLEGDNLRLQDEINKLQGVSRAAPVSSPTSSTKPLRYVFCLEAITDSKILKNLEKQTGAKCDYINVDESKNKQSHLKKEMDEGTTKLFIVYMMPTRFDIGEFNDYMSTFDALFDPKKTAVLLMWRPYTIGFDKKGTINLLPKYVLKASDGTEVSRLISINMTHHPQMQTEWIVEDPAKAYNDLHDKVEQLELLE